MGEVEGQLSPERDDDELLRFNDNAIFLGAILSISVVGALSPSLKLSKSSDSSCDIGMSSFSGLESKKISKFPSCPDWSDKNLMLLVLHTDFVSYYW